MRRLLQALTENSEIALVCLLMMIMFLMIIPIPTFLVDIFIALNFAIAILLLMTGLYIRHPLEISTFPSILLVSVLFRLALSITTTRLILTTGSAGDIITAFGGFVVGGNIVVGLVIFLIITVVQFVVITKGSERIAEVSARFNLDALPGKQLSIDSDLRNGILTTDQARGARSVLERQSQFYGSMDGATKFVKGDAIAGLVITFVNLIGGLIIGMGQLGMEFNEALAIYSQQTIGDGLVAQIPALFIAIAAGSVVTRVAKEESSNLGRDIGAELIAHPRTLQIGAVVLGVFALVPGLPWKTFAAISVLLFLGSFLVIRRQREKAEARPLAVDDFAMMSETMNSVHPMTPLSLELGRDLAHQIGGPAMEKAVLRVRERLYNRLGIWIPYIAFSSRDDIANDGYRVLLDEVVRTQGTIPSDQVELTDEPDFAALGDIAFEAREDVLPGKSIQMAPASELPKLDRLGLRYRRAEGILEEALDKVTENYGHQFLGLEETGLLLSHFSQQYPELVRQVQGASTLHKLSMVLQRLVADGVSIRNLRAMFHAYLEWVDREEDPVILSEYVRTGLKDQLCQPYVDPEGMMAILLLDSTTEEMIRRGIQVTTVGSYLSLDSESTTMITDAIQRYWSLAREKGANCVLVTSLDIRRYVRNMLKLNDIVIPVLSHQDVALDVRVHPLGVISLGPAPQPAE